MWGFLLCPFFPSIIHEADNGARSRGLGEDGFLDRHHGEGLLSVDMVWPHRFPGNPAENVGEADLCLQSPFLGSMALVLQPWGPAGTLTICWSRHGWQRYWKLENWQ